MCFCCSRCINHCKLLISLSRSLYYLLFARMILNPTFMQNILIFTTGKQFLFHAWLPMCVPASTLNLKTYNKNICQSCFYDLIIIFIIYYFLIISIINYYLLDWRDVASEKSLKCFLQRGLPSIIRKYFSIKATLKRDISAAYQWTVLFWQLPKLLPRMPQNTHPCMHTQKQPHAFPKLSAAACITDYCERAPALGFQRNVMTCQ